MDLTRAFSRFDPPAPFHLTIHGFETWLGLQPPAELASRSDSRAAWQAHLAACKQIIDNSAGLISICESIRDQMTPALSKPIIVFPWLVNESAPEPKNPDPDGKLRFTIPGGIAKHRRNYGVALEAFRCLAQETDRARLTLLGRPVDEYGQTVLQKAREINELAGCEIVSTFDRYVHQDEYDTVLAQTDYVLLPQTDLAVFGRTKASAALYDGLIRSIPVLVPEEMSFSDGFAAKYGSGILAYDDLLATLHDLLRLDSVGYQRLHREAAYNARNFTLEVQRERLEKELFSEASCAR